MAHVARYGQPVSASPNSERSEGHDSPSERICPPPSRLSRRVVGVGGQRRRPGTACATAVTACALRRRHVRRHTRHRRPRQEGARDGPHRRRLRDCRGRRAAENPDVRQARADRPADGRTGGGGHRRRGEVERGRRRCRRRCDRAGLRPPLAGRPCARAQGGAAVPWRSPAGRVCRRVRGRSVVEDAVTVFDRSKADSGRNRDRVVDRHRADQARRQHVPRQPEAESDGIDHRWRGGRRQPGCDNDGYPERRRRPRTRRVDRRGRHGAGALAGGRSHGSGVSRHGRRCRRHGEHERAPCARRLARRAAGTQDRRLSVRRPCRARAGRTALPQRHRHRKPAERGRLCPRRRRPEGSQLADLDITRARRFWPPPPAPVSSEIRAPDRSRRTSSATNSC